MADYSGVWIRVPPTDTAATILARLADELSHDGAFLYENCPDYIEADEVRWGAGNAHVVEAMHGLRTAGHGYVVADWGVYDAGAVDVYKPGFGDYTVATRDGEPVLSVDEIRDIKAVAPDAEAAIDEMIARLTIPQDLSGWVKEPA